MNGIHQSRDILVSRRAALQESPALVVSGGAPPVEQGTEPRRPRSYWLAAVVLAIIAGIAIYDLKLTTTSRPASSNPIRTAKVRPGTIVRTLRLTGSTAAGDSALL